MTLQQLRYVTTVAETGTMSEAARRLFVSQPGLTKAIRELEQEMGIIIFDRTNKGIEVSKDGAIFLGYARQVLEQASLLEERYKLQAGGKKEFSVSTQHYSFAVNAFVDLIKEFGGDNYDFSLRETQTYEIIDDTMISSTILPPDCKRRRPYARPPPFAVFMTLVPQLPLVVGNSPR